MLVLDLLAAATIALGAFLGARRGLWRMLAAGVSVALGTAAGLAVSDTLAAALRDLGVARPGDAVLGFFLPFALTSVYARFVTGLWLSRRLERRHEENRILGAACGVALAIVAVGLAGNLAGLHRDDRRGAPFVSWLASGPGEAASGVLAEVLGGTVAPARISSQVGPAPSGASVEDARGPRPEARPCALGEVVARAVDSDRIHARAREADAEASAAWLRH